MRPPRPGLFLAAMILAGTPAGCMMASVALAPTPITLATGVPGGIYHPVGNAICRMFNLTNEHQAAPCVALSSDGAVANIQRVERGASTFGLSNTAVAYAAFHGEGSFAAAGADSRLRLLIALYPEAFTVIARADTGIRTFEDLRDRRIGIGMSGAGYTFTRDVVLRYYGWTISAPDRVLELGPAEQNKALCDNEVDAIIFEAGHPSGLTQEATTGCRATLVPVAGPPIDRLLKAHPYYTASFIPAALYRGNPDNVPTFGSLAVLVTSSNQSDALAYGIVKAVFENIADFRRLHPALATLDTRQMVPSEAVMPIHSGAMRYFRTAGLVP